jgi:hypothetical protein
VGFDAARGAGALALGELFTRIQPGQGFGGLASTLRLILSGSK